MLHRLIGEHIALKIELAAEAVKVKADPGQLEQVILNLAINARDAMPGGGQLWLETQAIEVDTNYARLHTVPMTGSYAQLAVSDTGQGMDRETQARIFEPFFTTKEVGRGTGLGLATVYGIVKQSGGQVWVYSEPGQGTTFKVFLPRVQDPTEAVGWGLTPGETLVGQETVLLAEDDEVVRALVLEVLRSCGYTVLEARNGHDAFELAKDPAREIALLISDVVMPDIPGPELARRILVTRPALRVLFISGYTDTALLQRGMISPDAGFLQKPFAPQALARKVREVLAAAG
jgi:two-component system, cell cycle sensor histidine kinase and response regulator CckA